MDTLNLLQTARHRLQYSWTQGTWARDASGAEVDATGTAGTHFCSVGMIWHLEPETQ